MARRTWKRAQALIDPFEVPVFYDAVYRLPLPSASLPSGLELRRADYVAWYLLEGLKVSPECFHSAAAVSFEDLGAVHSRELVESLLEAETLAGVFAVHASEVSVDDVLATIRVACGATVEATGLALRRRRPVVNLLGGFHHAGRARTGPLCPVNDIAVAVAVARRQGFDGRVAVIDLDAHPPDGTADCFDGDDRVSISSISGSDWGPLPDWVDEVLLPEGTGDREYLRALDELLVRMPDADLAFVLAGGDVLAGDGLGALSVSMHGIRERDRRVAHALGSTPAVWLPGGGYSTRAWRVLAGTALVLGGRSSEVIDPDFDPLTAHFARIHSRLGREQLTDDELTLADLGLGPVERGPSKLLGFWTVSGLEYALTRYGIFAHTRRLGYSNLRVELDRASVGERMRVFGTSHGVEQVLVEMVVEERLVAEHRVLFVNWFTMRNPKARFTGDRPRLPGQDMPGLGLGRESAFLIAGMARRLGFEGTAYRPAWYHIAYIGRHTYRFVDPGRQGRFEAMLRDLSDLPLLEATRMVADGKVLINGEPYQWEADEMVMGLQLDQEREAVEAERERVRFELSG
ncbi:MAG: histone deacetylase [Deltaproteobacteria bacterium]|nr:histone deacetylase [Deltaproteobacteria bacterium]